MSEYLGTDNLEVMEEAVNYSGYLIARIMRELTEIGANKHGLCVDFGAGIGTFARALNSSGVQVECVELDLAQATLLKQGGFVVHDSLKAYASASVDCCYTFNVMEHIADDVACFIDMFDKLRPGGRLLVFVPAFQLLYSSMDRKVGHLRRYTRAELESKVTAAGFTILRNDYMDSIGFFVTLLFKLIGNDSGRIDRNALIIYDRILFPVSRILDRLFHHVLGKNVFLVAEKPL